MKDFWNLQLLLRDIRTIWMIVIQVNRIKLAADWTAFRLRHDWIYRIFTVINPEEADFGDPKEVLEAKMEERIIKYHRYIDKNGLADYVRTFKETIPESDSILLVYYPLLLWINFTNILWSILWGIIFWIGYQKWEIVWLCINSYLKIK